MTLLYYQCCCQKVVVNTDSADFEIVKATKVKIQRTYLPASSGRKVKKYSFWSLKEDRNGNRKHNRE
jgi:hypothetical protein